MFSGKYIFKFAILENLRIFQNCLFTRGVAAGNCICGACFLRKRSAAVECPFRLLTAFAATFPKGTALSSAARLYHSASELALSVIAMRCHLSQRERPWHGGKVSCFKRNVSGFARGSLSEGAVKPARFD